MQLAIEEMEAGDDYDFFVLQATDTSRTFYESLGFVRVGAVAKYAAILSTSVETTLVSLACPVGMCHRGRKWRRALSLAIDTGLFPTSQCENTS